MTAARCAWAEGSDLMRTYHDTEWGVPSRDDRYLFELLTLEGAQAGLSWSTILNKRERYRAVLDDFDPKLIAFYDQAKSAELLADPGIVRNRLKVASLVTNAAAFLKVQEEFGSFAQYLWRWVDGEPVTSRTPERASSELSDRISKDLKKRGFRFVGTTIVYAYLQAVGVIDDHAANCLAVR